MKMMPTVRLGGYLGLGIIRADVELTDTHADGTGAEK